MGVSKKDRRYILRNYPGSSIDDISGALGLKKKEVEEVLESSGVEVRSKASERPLLGKAAAHPLAIALLIALVSVVYLNSIRNGFHYDDIHSLLQNLGVRVEWDRNPESRWLFLKYFTQPDLFSSRPNVAMPRPLLMVTFGANYMWTKYEPWSWLLVNILLHMANTVIIYIGISHITGRSRIALFSAIIFAVHPINTETVNYINCRSESLTALFMLLCMYFFTRSLQTRSMRQRVFGFIFFGLGLLTKELAITLPATLFLIDFLLVKPSEEDEIPWKRRIIGWYVPLVAIAAVYMLYRHIVLDTLVVERTVRPISDNLLIQARVLMSYIRLLFLPFHQNISYENNAMLLKFAEFQRNFLYGGGIFPSVLGVFALVGAGLYWIRKHPFISFIIGNFFVVLSITSIVPLNAIMNEHRLYLPSMGAALLMGGLLSKVSEFYNEKMGRSNGWPPPVQFFALAIVFVFVCLTVYRNYSWRTDYTVWTDAAWKSPTKAQVISDLGNAFYRGGRALTPRGKYGIDGKVDKAEKIEIAEIFEVHVPIGPMDRELMEELYLKGLDRARDLYFWAVRVDPRYYKAWHNLGTIHYTYASMELSKNEEERGKMNLERATQFFRAATQISVSGESFNDWASSLMRLAQMEEDEKKQEQMYMQADQLYQKAFEHNPELSKSLVNRFIIRQRLGKEEGGLTLLEQAIRIYPLDPQPHILKGKYLFDRQMYREAKQAFEECLRVAPNQSQCRSGRDQSVRMMEQVTPITPATP